MSNRDTHRTICVSVDNFKKLCALGEVPESMNQIVTRLIDKHYDKLRQERENA